MTAVSRENAVLSGFPLPTKAESFRPERTRGLSSFGVPFPAPQRPRPSPGLTGHPGQASSAISTPVQGRLPAPIPLWDPWRLLLQLLENKLEADFSPSTLAAYSTRHKMSNINAESVSIIQCQSANPGPICGHSWSRMLCPTALPNSCVWLPAGSSLHTTGRSFLPLLQAELRTCTWEPAVDSSVRGHPQADSSWLKSHQSNN